ncbi:MAG: lysoplasmalogenase, partial [Myxococcales bacterium]|nr:lysoplasmalogenase [Myxococcales bacterium]
SLGFIVAAIGFGALDSRYGNIVLAGLVLGAIGDVCLLGQAKQYFIAGLVSFLLGHVAYVVAFSGLPISLTPALIAAAVITPLMALIARWVFPHAPDMRVPIGIYMLVIAAMCVVAIGAGAAGAPWMIPVGALMFTASDIAVVRDRFVAPGFMNRLWGLPLYYAAQLIIAWSIMAVNG